ncbi:MAG: carboxypeptidase-like regulatory domain-containing protein [Cellulophaga sp.]|nr:carboxypeptidase-like regulatory domain-containing protein [Cellulophaga sp.]
MRNSIPFKAITLLFFAVIAAKAQDNRQVLSGNIEAFNEEVQDVTVQNITSGKGTISDGYGFFEIAVQLNDSVVFSAVQFKKKTLVVNTEILSSKRIIVTLEEANNELDEVVVMPYNLTGDLTTDMKTQKVVVAATLGLPNAYVKKKTQSERLLAEADGGGWIKSAGAGYGGAGGTVNLHKILNRISGRTKMLKKRVARDEKNIITENIVEIFSDTIWSKNLKIPETRIYEFVYFCEADEAFTEIIASNDEIKLWEFLVQKSIVFRKENDLE